MCGVVRGRAGPGRRGGVLGDYKTEVVGHESNWGCVMWKGGDREGGVEVGERMCLYCPSACVRHTWCG